MGYSKSSQYYVEEYYFKIVLQFVEFFADYSLETLPL